MANPKTVTALLIQQDEEVLVEMYQSVKDEIQRLEVQKLLLEEALSKRSRRPSRSAISASGSSRQSGVKRADVLKVVRDKGAPTTPADVRNTLRLQGYDITGAAVRNHLRRLVDDGSLTTDGQGAYAVIHHSLARNGSGDPLFTDSQNQSESLS